MKDFGPERTLWRTTYYTGSTAKNFQSRRNKSEPKFKTKEGILHYRKKTDKEKCG